MIIYKKCSEVDINLVFEAFTIGFSDYIIKFSISKEDFINRFLGAEGNSLEFSHIALDCDKPIGVILGGIKVWEGIKTLRCGALAIHPEYRNRGVATELMKLHKDLAIENNCKQMFLEVIVGNDKAIKLYEKLGYERIYDLNYYSYDDIAKLKEFSIPNVYIQETDFADFKNNISDYKDYHINWQSDLHFVEKLDNVIYLLAYDNEKLVGYLCANKSGKINFIWVHRDSRLKGIGKALLSRFCNLTNVSKISITAPSNALLEGFLKHMGFVRDAFSQYEMYMTM